LCSVGTRRWLVIDSPPGLLAPPVRTAVERRARGLGLGGWTVTVMVPACSGCAAAIVFRLVGRRGAAFLSSLDAPRSR